MQAIKVTCSTKKVILLRQPQIEDQTKAAQAAANRLGDSAEKFAFSITMNQEMVKLLIVQIDGKRVKASQREDLNSLLTYAEFTEVMAVVGKLTAMEKEATLEFVDLKEASEPMPE